MKSFLLIYLLKKNEKEALKKNPKTARYISMAYDNVIYKISEHTTDNITAKEIDLLDITDHMKKKLKDTIKKKLTSADMKIIEKSKLRNKLIGLAGVGRKKADYLIGLGLTDINQLKTDKWKGRLPNSTILLFKHKPVQRIPNSSIKILEPKIAGFTGAKLVGSFLRKKKFSRDIDVMLVSDKQNAIDKYITYISKIFTTYVYAKGNHKASLLIKVGNKKYYKMDVFVVPKCNRYAMLLYATGSRTHNIKMRIIAKRKGYLLNQKGIFKNGNRIKIKSERDIFDILGVKYIKPEER